MRLISTDVYSFVFFSFCTAFIPPPPLPFAFFWPIRLICLSLFSFFIALAFLFLSLPLVFPRKIAACIDDILIEKKENLRNGSRSFKSVNKSSGEKKRIFLQFNVHFTGGKTHCCWNECDHIDTSNHHFLFADYHSEKTSTFECKYSIFTLNEQLCLHEFLFLRLHHKALRLIHPWLIKRLHWE